MTRRGRHPVTVVPGSGDPQGRSHTRPALRHARGAGEVHVDEVRVHVGYAVVELHLPGVRGLKEKRGLLRPVVEALRNDLDVSVAEVAWQDAWQRAALGVAVVDREATGVDRVLERVAAICERDPRVLVTAMHERVDVLTGGRG